MFKQYKKIPLPVEAVQFDGTEKHAEIIQEWSGQYAVIVFGFENVALRVVTHAGVTFAHKKDWIVKETYDVFKVIPDSEFSKRYEQLSENNS